MVIQMKIHTKGSFDDIGKVIKEYYSEKYAYLNAGLIVLRHTLEHIPKPFDFIKMIAKANNYNTEYCFMLDMQIPSGE